MVFSERSMVRSPLKKDSPTLVVPLLQKHITWPQFNLVINLVSSPQFRAANDMIQGQLKQIKCNGLDVSRQHPAG